MASTNKTNSIREILNRGILLSLCLSLLVGSGVLVVWQWVSQVRSNEYNASLVKETLQRDAADLLTSSMLKNYDAVGFQLKTALASLPLRCAYIELPGQRYPVKGYPEACALLFQSGDGAHREEITSGGMSIGPLVYILDSQPLPASSVIYLVLGFVALVGCVVLTWGVLIKMINTAILRPLGLLTANLPNGEFDSDPNTTCDEVVALADRLRQFRTQVASGAKREEFVRVAGMIAHNITTPTLVLEGVDLSALDDKNRAIYRSALSDIKGMISSLRAEAAAIKQLEGQTPALDVSPARVPAPANPLNTLSGIAPNAPEVVPRTSTLSTEHVMGLVEMAVSEKRMQARCAYDITFETSDGAYSAFAKVQRTELKVALLNLMNNAVEALSGAGRETGRIEVEVSASLDQVRITVKDNGPGIDPTILPRLGERGYSVGKNGSGLGIHHAQTVAKSWSGRCTIDSRLGHGTCVTFELPAAEPPAWFLSEIEIPPGKWVAVLDDDPNIGVVWSRRFKGTGRDITAFSSFSQGTDFKAWVREQNDADVLYLVDYELAGQSQNGIAVIEELGIGENSVLVTGRYDDPAIQKKVNWLGMRMIPKPLVGLVPIHIERNPGIRREKSPENALEKETGEVSL